MKCVANDEGELRRVTEYEAKQLVRKGWRYASKSAWKDKHRPRLDVAKAVAKTEVRRMRRI